MKSIPKGTLDPSYLLNLTKSTAFNIGPYFVVSQEPNVISSGDHKRATLVTLPIFLIAWKAIEQATGHRWKNTSFIRNSPSHQLGQSFDLAPDIAKAAEKFYAVTHNSDPVLYKRKVLLDQLASLQNLQFPNSERCALGIFVEPDHLHLQVLKKGAGENTNVSVITWPVYKGIYPDTKERADNLPKYI